MPRSREVTVLLLHATPREQAAYGVPHPSWDILIAWLAEHGLNPDDYRTGPKERIITGAAAARMAEALGSCIAELAIPDRPRLSPQERWAIEDNWPDCPLPSPAAWFPEGCPIPLQLIRRLAASGWFLAVERPFAGQSEYLDARMDELARQAN